MTEGTQTWGAWGWSWLGYGPAQEPTPEEHDPTEAAEEPLAQGPIGGFTWGPQPFQTFVGSAAPSYEEQARGFAQRVSEVVERAFSFIQREAQQSIDLTELYRAAHAFVVEFTHLIHEIFPFIPELEHLSEEAPPPPAPPRPLAEPVKILPEEDQRLVDEWADVLQKAIYPHVNMGPLDENARQFCQLGARLGVGVAVQVKTGAQLHYLGEDQQVQTRLKQIVHELCTGLRERVGETGFNGFKTSLLATLKPYLLASLKIMQGGYCSHGAPENKKREEGRQAQQKVLGELKQAKLLLPPFWTTKEDYREAIRRHYYDKLKKHLGHLQQKIPELNQFGVAAIASIAATQVTDAIYSATSTEAVNGYFLNVKEALTAPSNPTQATRKVLDPEEETLVYDTISLLLKDLCNSNWFVLKGASLFKGPIVTAIDTALQGVMTPDEKGVAPKMSVVNAALANLVQKLEDPLSSSSLTPQQVKEVEEFFNPTKSPTMLLDATGGHAGLCQLRDYCLYQPEVIRNFICLLIDDTIERTWPSK
ncbi:MAG: hypothetical protein AB7F31_07090 [Parachlamydiales bacterium]